MALIGTISKAHEIRETLLNRQSGKWLLSQNNPDEFEYYMIGIELLKSDLTTSQFFVFPVNPNAISFNDASLTKVTKTAGGISVLKNNQFNIKDISLSGTFVRDFKVLIGDTFNDLVSNFQEQDGNSTAKSVYNTTKNSFSSNVKTGYGCTKVLEDILNQSVQKDEYGGTQFLVLYNLAFNQRFFVEVVNKKFSQSLENNMMWNYQIELKTIGNSTSCCFLNSD